VRGEWNEGGGVRGSVESNYTKESIQSLQPEENAK